MSTMKKLARKLKKSSCDDDDKFCLPTSDDSRPIDTQEQEEIVRSFENVEARQSRIWWRYDIVNSVVEVEGVTNEGANEQGDDNDAEGKRVGSELENDCDAILMSKEEMERCSASRKDGIDSLHEIRLRYSYCAFIQNLVIQLDVPQTTMRTAMILCHLFFIRRSHACHDRFRSDIVNGVVEVEGVTNEGENEQGDDNATEDAEKGVPNFWLNAMKTHEVLAKEITEQDEGALQYLIDVKWCRVENPKGFKLEFTNTLLTKTYHMIDEDEPILEKAIVTEIEWHPWKCLCTLIEHPYSDF